VSVPNILLIGWNEDWLTSLDRNLPERSVTVLEERDLYAGKGLAAKRAHHPVLGEVRFTAYQQADDYRPDARRLAAEQPFDAVLPGLEYAVEAAAVVADELGLPGAGSAAAATLRDKAALRRAAERAGIANPAFREVTSVAELREFASGREVVLKPANRQASLGVQLLTEDDDLDAAWRDCVTADEGVQVADRPMRWTYLVEERLAGDVYSVEALVCEGEVAFANVTRQDTAPGRHPVKTAHLLPAPPAPGVDRLPELTGRLANAAGFRTGVLHAEWIVGSAGPHLVECAGRPPGDFVVDLVHLAHGVDLYRETMRALAGQPVDLAPGDPGFAAIRFVHAARSGVLVRVEGVERARETPGVERIVTQPAGVHIHPAKTLWDRVAAAIATGRTADEAHATATTAAGHLVPVVE
jgi:biotin carboxylase